MFRLVLGTGNLLCVITAAFNYQGKWVSWLDLQFESFPTNLVIDLGQEIMDNLYSMDALNLVKEIKDDILIEQKVGSCWYKK